MSAAEATVVLRGCDALVRPGELREHVDVAIVGNRIASVAPTGGELAPEAEVLDAVGLLAMPGLVMVLVDLLGDGLAEPPPATLAAMRKVEDFRRLVLEGIAA